MSQQEEIKILIVDDSATIRSVVAKHLGDGYTTLQAENGEVAWQLIEEDEHISLIFADLHMPVMNGMLLLKQIRESECERISNMPVIMLTGHEDTEAAKQASYNMGATDFVSKPFSELDIKSRVRSYADLNRKIAALEQNVTHDTLTGLLNRNGFRELAEKAMSGTRRHDFELTVLRVQVVDLGNIGLNHGKEIVEQIIRCIASNLQNSLRQEEVIAHFGMGQFAVLLPMTKAFKAHIVAMRLKAATTKLAFKLDDKVIRTDLAVGMDSTEGYSEEQTLDDLCMQVERALEVSVNDRACNVVRYDETIVTEQDDIADESGIEQASDTSAGVSGSTIDAEALNQLDAAVMGRYMAAILSGDFESIPDKHLEAMIQPLEAFLKYANERQDISLNLSGM